MSTQKVPVSSVNTLDSVVAEMRVLNAAAATSNNAEWLTPELVAMVGSVAANLITAAAVVGLLDASSAQEIIKATSAVIAAVGTISVNAVIVWKYLSGRAEIKKEVVQAQYRYAELALVERVQAASGR